MSMEPIHVTWGLKVEHKWNAVSSIVLQSTDKCLHSGLMTQLLIHQASPVFPALRVHLCPVVSHR